MQTKLIQFDSDEYRQMIQLRIEALLQPIGVPASFFVPQNERDDIFISAFEADKIIACCVLTKKDNHTIQLRQMAVHPIQQGKGIGAKLIKFAEAVAKENGYKILMMHARDPAVDFYKKYGYNIVGEQIFEVGMGHHKMKNNSASNPVSFARE